MNKQQEDILNTQLQSEETPNKESLYKSEEIQGTPFHLIYLESKGWFIAMGNARLTEATETKEEQLEKLEKEKWNIVLHCAIIVVERWKEFEKLK